MLFTKKAMSFTHSANLGPFYVLGFMLGTWDTAVNEMDEYLFSRNLNSDRAQRQTDMHICKVLRKTSKLGTERDWLWCEVPLVIFNLRPKGWRDSSHPQNKSKMFCNSANSSFFQELSWTTLSVDKNTLVNLDIVQTHQFGKPVEFKTETKSCLKAWLPWWCDDVYTNVP